MFSPLIRIVPRPSPLRERTIAARSVPYHTPESRFVSTIREALSLCRVSGPKYRRAMYGDQCFALAAERCFNEMLAAGAAEDQIRRVGAAFNRAIRDMLHSRHQARPALVDDLIDQETAVNGFQNVDANAVIRFGTLADCNKLWESTRAQNTAGDALMEALEDRCRQLLEDARR